MAHKHLHELLKEDQEPFLLKNYIADRRCQLKQPLPKTHIQLKKRKPISEASSFSGNFCKNGCLFSFHDSPDVRKSPLWSPAKSPLKNPNAILLHIPARTAAMLLEAALRIQKQSSPKPKTQNKNVGFGIFGSMLKRLTQRNRQRKREIGGDGIRVSVKDILRWDSSVGRKKFTAESKNDSEKMVGVEDKSASEMGFSCSYNGRLSSVWSDSNEEKSLDLETSSSSLSELSEENDFVSKARQDLDFASCEKDFCTSPFRFVLQRSSSSGHRTPDFSSPATSPCRHKTEEKEKHEEESLNKFQIEEEEEEKEQLSPVSILDPPFEDENEDEEGSFDLECSYAIVQRAKQQLLHKLRRFEKLAELDPVELEKRMLEGLGDDEEDDHVGESEDCEDDDNDDAGSVAPVDELVRLALSKSGFHQVREIPQDMKRLVSDLIAQEEGEQNCSNTCTEVVVVAERVCRRLESWKGVESNTIDMMVELDLRREFGGWNKNEEQVEETAIEIELAILGLLVEELSEELVCLTGI